MKEVKLVSHITWSCSSRHPSPPGVREVTCLTKLGHVLLLPISQPPQLLLLAACCWGGVGWLGWSGLKEYVNPLLISPVV